MHATTINGRTIADNIKARLGIQIKKLKAEHGLTPGLAVIIVGDNPASQVYVRNKVKQTKALGMHSEEILLPADTNEATLMAEIDRLNADDAIHGILVQLPLPKGLDEQAVIARIAPEKDVDGFHINNVGRLATGAPTLVPCTPLGCMHLLHTLGINLSGLHAVVIGRSNIVGKPMAHLLLQANCTVTIAHSRTANLPALVKQADIVVAAVGRPEMVTGDWLKPGAIVIDVGINRIEKPDGSTKLVGDVAFESASHVASAITPVPGGVGPMTIACLLVNTVRAAAAMASIALDADPLENTTLAA